MAKSAMIRARTEPGLKAEVDKILDKLGLTCSEAINLFFKQVTLRKGIPFDVAMPNKATLKAMKDVQEGKLHKAKDLNDLFEQLGIGNLRNSKNLTSQISKSIRSAKKIQKLMKEGYIAEAKEDRVICKEWESTLADGLDKELPLSNARAISLMWKKKLSNRRQSDSAKLIRKDRNR